MIFYNTWIYFICLSSHDIYIMSVQTLERPLLAAKIPNYKAPEVASPRSTATKLVSQ